MTKTEKYKWLLILKISGKWNDPCQYCHKRLSCIDTPMTICDNIDLIHKMRKIYE